jgi:MFS family permease
MTVPVRPDRGLRNARFAAAAMFLTNGALIANLVPRLPQIKADLELGNAAYGLAVAATPAGGIFVGLAAGMVLRRLGSAATAVVGTAVTGAALLATGLAPSAFALAAMLFAAGAADAIADVAQNAHGLRVQRAYGRSIINSFHALWSIGAVLGGAMAAAAIALDVPIGIHLGATAVLLTLIALTAYRFRLPGPDEEPSEKAEEGRSPARSVLGVRTVLVLAALVLISAGGAFVEDAGSSWATLYLSVNLNAPTALAASGFIALVGAQFIGRLLGDRMVDRFGQRAVARFGGILVALGMGLALAFPSVPVTILGFAAAGFGVATLIPAAMHQADELPGLRAGTGLTVVSWLLRLGFMCAAPLVGWIADNAGLRAGLLVVPAAGVVVVVLAGVLQGKRR